MRISIGRTFNLGNYNTIRVDVEAEFNISPDDLEKINDATDSLAIAINHIKARAMQKMEMAKNDTTDRG